ncbi:MAG: DegV family protein [Faecalibacterium sp.]|nr:DegV family protein [Faecalibacterium sp.]
MIRILTDSASDITPAEAALLNVTVVPLNVTFEDGTVIRDKLDMTNDEFYTAMAGCKKLPITSQPSPELFAAEFAAAKAAGDQTIVIHISGGLSGTGQAARIGADLADYEAAYFVDSLTATVAEALLVRLAVKLRDEGKTAAQITEELEQAKKHLHLLAVIDDLNNLRKGGRLSAAGAIAGGMLSIKPIIAIVEGKIAVVNKARGLPGAYVNLFKKIEELGGIDTSYDYMAVYTNSVRQVESIQKYLTGNLSLDKALVGQVGPVIGTHAGAGAFGFAFFDAKANEETA